MLTIEFYDTQEKPIKKANFNTLNEVLRELEFGSPEDARIARIFDVNRAPGDRALLFMKNGIYWQTVIEDWA